MCKQKVSGISDEHNNIKCVNKDLVEFLLEMCVDIELVEFLLDMCVNKELVEFLLRCV